EPHHARVVTEVLLAQLGVAVQPELAPDRVLERPGQEVGEEVRARLLLQRLANFLPREHVVAVIARQPREPEPIQRAVRAAFPVRERHDVPTGRGLGHRGSDPLRAVVQQRRHRDDVQVPPPAPGDPADIQSQRPARDDGAGHPGNASWSMNISLKSARPDSSTYSTSRRIEYASARSRTDRAAILAPSPATLPADTIRGRAICGTSPPRRGLKGARFAQTPPASSTCVISRTSTPSSPSRMLHPVAIEALANWSSRTSRWDRNTARSGSLEPRQSSTNTRS